jgi:hypothetical protein
MQIPKACIPGRLKQQAHDDEVSVTDVFGREFVGRRERSEPDAHPIAAFKRFRLPANLADELT